MSTVETAQYVIMLAIVFQLKHLVVDYLLQNTYMLGKFKEEGWVGPLLAHTSMHGVGTLLIALLYGVINPVAFALAIFDTMAHFVIDKAKVEWSRGLDPKTNKSFWWALGVDQLCHHITHYIMIIVIVMSLAKIGGLS